MKKKILSLLIAGCMCLMFSACSESKTNESTTTASTSAVALAQNEVSIMGQNLKPGMVLTEAMVENFGQANEILEAPSCHFDGDDTIYFYDNFTLYTYTDNDEQVIYLIELVNGETALNSGVKVGMSKADAIALQGDAFTEQGVIIRYEIDKVYFDFTIDENQNISLIEILVD